MYTTHDPWLRDRDFLFWARSKNPENPKIPKKSRVKNP